MVILVPNYGPIYHPICYTLTQVTDDLDQVIIWPTDEHHIHSSLGKLDTQDIKYHEPHIMSSQDSHMHVKYLYTSQFTLELRPLSKALFSLECWRGVQVWDNYPGLLVWFLLSSLHWLDSKFGISINPTNTKISIEPIVVKCNIGIHEMFLLVVMY